MKVDESIPSIEGCLKNMNSRLPQLTKNLEKVQKIAVLLVKLNLTKLESNSQSSIGQRLQGMAKYTWSLTDYLKNPFGSKTPETTSNDAEKNSIDSNEIESPNPTVEKEAMDSPPVLQKSPIVQENKQPSLISELNDKMESILSSLKQKTPENSEIPQIQDELERYLLFPLIVASNH